MLEQMIPLERAKSREIYSKARQVIPGGVNSPVRSFPGLDQTPLIAKSGAGDLVFDVDDHSYIDYCQSWGAMILGHAHPFVTSVIKEQIERGSSFGIATEVEEKLATLVTQRIKGLEKVRFVSSGTEATMSALRLARGYTGRSLCLKFVGHYHGHADPFLVQAGSGVADLTSSSSSAGVPKGAIGETLVIPYNDFDALDETFRQYGEELACIILEPIAANMGVVSPKEGFLERIRELTLKAGALLIFDEVITGFRVAKGGASELFGITPDLYCFGKIIGGGFPAACFGGASHIMEKLAPLGDVYQAGTLSGNPVAMHAGLQTLQLLDEPGFYEALEEKTKIITEPVAGYIKAHRLPATIHRVGSLFTLFLGQKEISSIEDVKRCDASSFKALFQTLFQQGIYLSPSQFEANFVSSAHTEAHLLKTRDALLAFLESHY